MDWKSLYLSANGRIGQKDFWIGWLILFVVSLVLGMVLAGAPPISAIVGIILLYPFYCLLAKRFQDIGKTGKLALVPIVISVVCQLLILVSALGMLGAAATGDAGVLTGAAVGMAGVGMLAFVGLIVSLVFVLWAGLTKGDPGPNAYGPPPATMIGGATPAA